MITETLAPVAPLIEPMLLDHRAHRAVEEYDALLEQLLQTLDTRTALSLIYRSYSKRRRSDTRARALLAGIECPLRGYARHASNVLLMRAPLQAQLAAGTPEPSDGCSTRDRSRRSARRD